MWRLLRLNYLFIRVSTVLQNLTMRARSWLMVRGMSRHGAQNTPPQPWLENPCAIDLFCGT